MDRLQQKHTLFIKLGALFGPLLRLAESPDQYDEQEKAETLGRFFFEYPQLNSDFQAFSNGQPGHTYTIEVEKFYSSLNSLVSHLISGVPLANIVHTSLTAAQAAIDAVPVPRTSVILEAGSPFTTYCKLKELSEVDATASLIWLDPYMSASIFHRYARSVRANVPVTLVTKEPSTGARSRDKTRWTEFLDVSRLYAQERGQALYRLVLQPSLHDRWVVFDRKRIYMLGGSAKDAGDKDYFTITSVEPSPENLQKIDANIGTGTEGFGPTTPQHC